jgi:glycosyltransferase involved in cell wall biosynthesis
LASVVIPARNEASHIGKCIESLLAQRDLPGSIEILVSDGMSADDTRAIVEEYARKDPRVRLVDNPRRIVSTALNEAIRLAQGEIILRVDAHTVVEDDYVAACIDVLRRSGADNVGGPWRAAPGDSFWSRSIAATFQHPFAVGGARSHRLDYEGPADSVYLGCWRRRVFDEVGLFDEELVRNQDDEFNLRLNRRGKTVWQSPRIRCWYAARNTLSSLWAQYFQYGFWKIRVMQKHRMPASIRHVVPLAFVCGLLVGASLSFLHPLLAWVYVGACALYLLMVVAASAHVALKKGLRLLPFLPATFITYHLAYGLGSLCGAAHFLVLRRGGAEAGRAWKRLTR